MKKFYSIVLMATALLMGTNVWASNQTVTTGSFEALNAAIVATGGNDTVTLSTDIIENVTTNNWVGTWIGAAAYDADAQKITLDLNGHSINISADGGNYVVYPFVITKGELKVINSKGANEPSKIEVTVKTDEKGKGTNVFFVFGSYDYKIDPKGDNPFTHLEIGENVNVITNNGTVICVDQKTIDNAVKTNYHTRYFTNRGFAFGARVDVKGTLISQGGYKCYGIKTNGNLGFPGDDTWVVNTADWIDDDYKANVGSDAAIANAPYVHVWPTATVLTDNNKLQDASAAAYCSGYAQWLVEGTCDGATGLYASSGAIEIKDATITSSAVEYDAPKGVGHADGCGSAIVINSRDAYAGSVEMEISGDTKVSAQSGYAIEEAVNTKITTDPDTGEPKQETKIDNISITGGTFQGGTNPDTHEVQPAIIISNPTAEDEDAKVVVYGANVTGGAEVGTSGTLADLLPQGEQSHITEVTDPNTGKVTLVVSEGADPIDDANVAGHAADARINWTGATEALNTDVTLAELEINQATEQKLTVNDGVTLTVGRVVLGTKAQIIVEAGAKFIVTGEQGIVAPSVDNITLKTQEGKPAIFLFNPAVTSNRHPSATVEFISKSCRKPTKNIYQRFGIPMNGQLESIVAENNHETRFFVFDYTANKWNGIGYINPSAGYEGDPLDLSKMASPFDYYQLLDFDATDPGTIFTMKGNLVGNGEPALDILANSWKGFANSYMGKMKLSELLKLIPSTVDKAIYLYNVNSTFASWDPVTNLNLGNQMIDPMQPFLIRNRYDGAVVNMDFNEVVYKPTLGIAQSAPRRALASDLTMAKLTIENDHSSDFVIVAESNEFTPAFDNGYDASKFMNEEINLYVEADENMSIFATNSLENTMLGVSSKLGGKYTIKFSDVRGNCLILVDNMTGVQTPIVEGNSYEFEMDADVTNDGRFHIVGVRNAPTGIENAAVTEGAQAVYTVLGQYVGTIDKWNTLPAGIYVVGGVKIAK